MCKEEMPLDPTNLEEFLIRSFYSTKDRDHLKSIAADPKTLCHSSISGICKSDKSTIVKYGRNDLN